MVKQFIKHWKDKRITEIVDRFSFVYVIIGCALSVWTLSPILKTPLFIKWSEADSLLIILIVPIVIVAIMVGVTLVYGIVRTVCMLIVKPRKKLEGITTNIGEWKYNFNDGYKCHHKGFDFEVDVSSLGDEDSRKKIDVFCKMIVKDFEKIEKKLLTQIVEDKATIEMFDEIDEPSFDGDCVKTIEELQDYKLDKHFSISVDYSMFVIFYYKGDFRSNYVEISVQLDNNFKVANFQFGS